MPVDVVRDDLNIKDLVITPNESKYFDPTSLIDEKDWEEMIKVITWSSGRLDLNGVEQVHDLSRLFPGKSSEYKVSSDEIDNVIEDLLSSPLRGEFHNFILGAANILSIRPDKRDKLGLNIVTLNEALGRVGQWKLNLNWHSYHLRIHDVVACYPNMKDRFTSLTTREISSFKKYIDNHPPLDWRKVAIIKLTHPELLPDLSSYIEDGKNSFLSNLEITRILPPNIYNSGEWKGLTHDMFLLALLQAERVWLEDDGWHFETLLGNEEKEKPLPERRKY